MLYKGMAAEVDNEKSASFFHCAINYGNREAFLYLGRQYDWRMEEDENKPVELYMGGEELQNRIVYIK